MRHVFILLTFVTTGLFSQTVEVDKNFDLSFAYNIGSANLENNQLGVVNGNVNTASLQASYRLFEDTFLNDIRLQSGFSFTEFSSDTNINGLSAAFRNTYLQVPLNVIFSKTSENEKYRFNFGGGINANYLLKVDLDQLSGDTDENINDITIGYQILAGIDYFLHEDFYIGIHVGGHGDFEEIEHDGITNKLERGSFLQLSFGTRF